MKHVNPEDWDRQEHAMERAIRQQHDEQIAILRAHNVWYGPEHLRPEPVPEPIIEPEIRPGMSLAERIIAMCAHSQNIDVASIRDKYRAVGAVIARQVAAYLIRKHCRTDDEGHVVSAIIGKMLGGRDRTTVVHSLKVVNADLADGGERFAAIIEHVETELELR